MKTIGFVILLTVICGCRTHPQTVDLLQIHRQRSAELGDVTVEPPKTIPFEFQDERAVYLEQYRAGFRSGMTGIAFCPLLAADIPHRDAYIKGWYDGQSQGLAQSPWGLHGLTETNWAPIQTSQAMSLRTEPER